MIEIESSGNEMQHKKNTISTKHKIEAQIRYK